jgi:hypothetical protein
VTTARGGRRLTVSSDVPRCADLARAQHTDPVGTAGAYDVFVLFEHPAPWPAAIADDPLVHAVTRAANDAVETGVRVRVQVIRRDGPTGDRTMIVYQHDPSEPFVAYRRSEAIMPADAATRVVGELIRRRHDPPPAAITDILVCAHGSRDRCCGSLGTRLWGASAQRDDVRVWRTSHTGGHRFAPTALSFPAGQCWAFLDEDVLHGIVSRSHPPDQLRHHYRGATFVAPAAQVAEREAFVRHGWEWLSWSRQVEPLSGGRVRIRFRDGDGRGRAYEARVEPAREIPTPPCGERTGPTSPTVKEWRLTRFDLLDAEE